MGQRISIHALLAESDGRRDSHSARAIIFLSTLSLRRATASNHRERQEQHISIHALLAESVRAIGGLHGNSFYFYPRSPCGERP